MGSDVLSPPFYIFLQNLKFIEIRYEDFLTFNIVHISGLALNWCMVPKVASSSISELILPYLKKLKRKLPSPHDPQRKVWKRAGHLSHSDFVHQLQRRTPSFLITRHPFARIVSAYKNKIESRKKFRDGNGFYINWSSKIIKSVYMLYQLDQSVNLLEVIC